MLNSKFTIKFLWVFLLLLAVIITVIPFISFSEADAKTNTLQSSEFGPDSDYGTAEYYDYNYPGWRDHVITTSDIEENNVLKTGTYYINNDIYLERKRIIIDGDVTIRFVQDYGYSRPTLRKLAIDNSLAAIEINNPSSLHVEGRGNIILEGGAIGMTFGGNAGRWGTVKGDPWTQISGQGGWGGPGSDGGSAAIGTNGGAGGERGAGGESVSPPSVQDAIDGKDGASGKNGLPAKEFGYFSQSGYITLDLKGGTLGREIHPYAADWAGWLGDFDDPYWKYYVGGGGGGGAGGVGYPAATIGTGGAGGGGGGGGGSGGCEYDFFSPVFGGREFFRCAGGGGAAGCGYIKNFGGLADQSLKDNGDDMQSMPTAGADWEGGDYAAVEGQLQGGAKSTGEGADGGNGGNGGLAFPSVNNHPVYLSNLESHDYNYADNYLPGRESDRYQCYPADECRIVFDGYGKYDYPTYEYTGNAIEPNFQVVHIPTGQIVDKNSYDVLFSNNTYPGTAYVVLITKSKSFNYTYMTKEDMSKISDKVTHFYISPSDNLSLMSTNKGNLDDKINSGVIDLAALKAIENEDVLATQTIVDNFKSSNYYTNNNNTESSVYSVNSSGQIEKLESAFVAPDNSSNESLTNLIILLAVIVLGSCGLYFVLRKFVILKDKAR